MALPGLPGLALRSGLGGGTPACFNIQAITVYEKDKEDMTQMRKAASQADILEQAQQPVARSGRGGGGRGGGEGAFLTALWSSEHAELSTNYTSPLTDSTGKPTCCQVRPIPDKTGMT